MDFPPFVMVYHKRTQSPIHAEPKQYDNQGVMIALDRLEEIERYIDDGRIPQDCCSVLVGEGEALNNKGLGVKGRNNALILYTTKSQIRKRCQNRNFNDVKAFHY